MCVFVFLEFCEEGDPPPPHTALAQSSSHGQRAVEVMSSWCATDNEPEGDPLIQSLCSLFLPAPSLSLSLSVSLCHSLSLCLTPPLSFSLFRVPCSPLLCCVSFSVMLTLLCSVPCCFWPFSLLFLLFLTGSLSLPYCLPLSRSPFSS